MDAKASKQTEEKEATADVKASKQTEEEEVFANVKSSDQREVFTNAEKHRNTEKMGKKYEKDEKEFRQK